MTWTPISSRDANATFLGEVTGIYEELLDQKMLDAAYHSYDNMSQELGCLPTQGFYLEALRSTLASTPVAERMSWMSERQTTKTEDLAYCLIGIFDANMPLLYGEGVKAFRRLQETIIQASTDQSIFAWDPLPYPIIESGRYGELWESVGHLSQQGILAPGPSYFAWWTQLKKAYCGASILSWHDHAGVEEFKLSNAGLKIALRILRMEVSQEVTGYGAINLISTPQSCLATEPAPLLLERQSNITYAALGCGISLYSGEGRLAMRICLRLKTVSANLVGDRLLTRFDQLPNMQGDLIFVRQRPVVEHEDAMPMIPMIIKGNQWWPK